MRQLFRDGSKRPLVTTTYPEGDFGTPLGALSSLSLKTILRRYFRRFLDSSGSSHDWELFSFSRSGSPKASWVPYLVRYLDN